MANRCKQTTKRGRACSAYAQDDSDYCYTHDPRHSSERRRARQLGGHNSRKPKGQPFLSENDVATTKGLIASIGRVIKETSTLGHSVSRDHTLGQLMRIQSQLIAQYNDELRQKAEDYKAEKIAKDFTKSVGQLAGAVGDLIQKEIVNSKPQSPREPPSYTVH